MRCDHEKPNVVLSVMHISDITLFAAQTCKNISKNVQAVAVFADRTANGITGTNHIYMYILHSYYGLCRFHLCNRPITEIWDCHYLSMFW